MVTAKSCGNLENMVTAHFGNNLKIMVTTKGGGNPILLRNIPDGLTLSSLTGKGLEGLPFSPSGGRHDP